MVDSTSTIGMTTSDAAKIIKGKIGTDVTLTILRPSTKQKIDFILKRDNITVKHIPYWGIDENGVGYIRITKFSKNVAKDFKKALLALDNLTHDFPNHPILYIIGGDCYVPLNEYERAISCYEEAIKLSPDNIKAYIKKNR